MKKIHINDIFVLKPFDTGEMSNWCRDNYFLVKRDDEANRFVFIDSYWGFADKNAKRLTWQEIHKLGKASFYFNANQVRKIDSKDEWERYDKKQRFVVPQQHGEVTKYFVSTDAVQDKATILKLIDKDIRVEKNNVKQAHRRLNRLTAQRLKVEAGELEAY